MMTFVFPFILFIESYLVSLVGVDKDVEENIHSILMFKEKEKL